MKYSDLLEERGWQGSVGDFEQIVLDTFVKMFPNMTDEQILFRPTKCAAPFVKAIVAQTGITGNTTQKESLVLGLLVRNRKRNKAVS